MSSILIINPNPDQALSLARLLSEKKYKVVTCNNVEEGLRGYRERVADLVILELGQIDGTGLEILRTLKEINSQGPVLIITGEATTDTAIQAIKLGAYDYVLRPFDESRLLTLIDEILSSGRQINPDTAWSPASEKAHLSDGIVGKSPVMQEVYKMIGRVAPSDVNVLIRGESGTGKELVARAIFKYSKRARKPFMAINCAAIPEHLLESELFGYEKGAFTGATRRKSGKFEQADGGALFLDEIGDMPLSTQSKVLRVLQEGTFQRLGGEETVQIDVRVIAATNKNLESMIEQNDFREDLYYRIKVITITLPPLRLRRDDIPGLIHNFIERYQPAGNSASMSISAEGLRELQEYHWPGNVRELENVIKRAVVLSKGRMISADLLHEGFERFQQTAANSAALPDEGILSAAEIDSFDGALHERVMSSTEKNLILKVLQKTRGNQVQAARILGISRMMLRDRIEKYAISKEINVKLNTGTAR